MHCYLPAVLNIISYAMDIDNKCMHPKDCKDGLRPPGASKCGWPKKCKVQEASVASIGQDTFQYFENNMI
jgi:hypothetical protein